MQRLAPSAIRILKKQSFSPFYLNSISPGVHTAVQANLFLFTHNIQSRSISIMSASIQSPRPGAYDTSYSTAVRKHNRTYGLIPPAVESIDLQVMRCLEQLARKSKGIDKYLYLSGLRNTNIHLFYRLVVQHIKTIAPLIYTPTVGEACLQWSHNYVQPEGLYISYSDRGNIKSILDNWPEANVEITVITDGSRILGLG